MAAEAELLKLARATLKKVFKEGVKSVSRDELENLFKSRVGKRLYRQEADPEYLIEEGWRKPQHSMHDIPGLYYGISRKGIAARFGEPNVEGIRRPGSISASSLVDSEDAFLLGAKKAADARPAGVDFLERPYEDVPPRGEVIQIKPGNVLAKIRHKGKDYYRILALLGALSRLQEQGDIEDGNSTEGY